MAMSLAGEKGLPKENKEWLEAQLTPIYFNAVTKINLQNVLEIYSEYMYRFSGYCDEPGDNFKPVVPKVNIMVALVPPSRSKNYHNVSIRFLDKNDKWHIHRIS